jgi:hypothetical protein
VQGEVSTGEVSTGEEKAAAPQVTMNPDFTVLSPDPRPAYGLESGRGVVRGYARIFPTIERLNYRKSL